MELLPSGRFPELAFQVLQKRLDFLRGSRLIRRDSKAGEILIAQDAALSLSQNEDILKQWDVLYSRIAVFITLQAVLERGVRGEGQ